MITNAVKDLENFVPFTQKTLPVEEPLAYGHRACQGCGEVLALRLAMKALGMNTIVASATGCMEIITSSFPQTAWRIPWIHVAFENAAAVASGVESALSAMTRKGKIKDNNINVVAMAGDGGTADIGLQALSGALNRGHNFVYLCFDNEAYMNTGVQRSGCTPFGARTTTSPPGALSIGQQTWKKNVPAIAEAHHIPYVATATIAYHLDLMNKVKKASLIKGPAYVHIFSPCPTGWGSKGEDAIESSRLVVQTKIFPLYEVIDGKVYLTKEIKNPKPVEEYLKTQKRFKHLDQKTTAIIQEKVDQEYNILMNRAEQPKK
ncbi:MAG: pyruvate synthase subunit PorB [Pseudomonadota bacterium]